MMDTTLPGNHGMGRAILSPGFHLAFYIGIIAWEMATSILLWWSVLRLLRALRLPGSEIQCRETNGGSSPHALVADVVSGISHRRRRVVSHVAIARLEWQGCSLSEFWRCRSSAFDSLAARKPASKPDRPRVGAGWCCQFPIPKPPSC